MATGRVVSTLVSCIAVCGCAAVVTGMARAGDTTPRRNDSGDRAVAAEYQPRVVQVPTTTPASPSASSASATSASATSAPAGTASPLPRSTAAATSAPAPRTNSPVQTSVAARPVVRPAAPRPAVTHARVAAKPAPKPAAKPAAKPASKPAGQSLPLRYSVGSATRVITVTAGSSHSTTARLQRWVKLSNGRWQKYGGSVRAYVGSDGIGSASETRSKTPAGSFTLTQAFGRYSDPGTSLPYFKTNPSDYWISSPGKYYNTHRRCGSCGYNNGVNERLYYVNPEYRYAALIDYNTRNAPGGVKQGKGSAFFLHVANGSATAGCVAIPQSNLVSVLRWLTPATHPRILIGVT